MIKPIATPRVVWVIQIHYVCPASPNAPGTRSNVTIAKKQTARNVWTRCEPLLPQQIIW